MERTLDNRKENEGNKFQCECGSTDFIQETYVKAQEKVNIIKRNNDIMILSLDMMKPEDEDIEYNNTFACQGCGKEYYIATVNGADVIHKDFEE